MVKSLQYILCCVLSNQLYQLHFFIVIWFSVEAHIVGIKAKMKFFFCRRFGYSRLSFFLLVCLRTLYTFVLRYTTRKVFIFFFYLILRRLGGLGAQGLRGCRCSVMRSVMCSVLRSVSRNTLIPGNLIISINSSSFWELLEVPTSYSGTKRYSVSLLRRLPDCRI